MRTHVTPKVNEAILEGPEVTAMNRVKPALEWLDKTTAGLPHMKAVNDDAKVAAAAITRLIAAGPKFNLTPPVAPEAKK